jgi:hypothetical protein
MTPLERVIAEQSAQALSRKINRAALLALDDGLLVRRAYREGNSDPAKNVFYEDQAGGHHSFLAILSLVAYSLAEIRPDHRESSETFIAITDRGRAALAKMGSAA